MKPDLRLLGLLRQTVILADANPCLCNRKKERRKKKMEGLPDAAVFATRLKNTLIQYHSIEDDKWRVAKKMVNYLNYFYLGFIL